MLIFVLFEYYNHIAPLWFWKVLSKTTKKTTIVDKINQNREVITSQFLNRQWSFAYFILSFAFFNALSALLVLFVLGKFYELAWQSGGGREQLFTYLLFLPHNISELSLFFVVLIFLKTAFTWGEKYTAALLGERFVQHLRQ